MVLEGRVGSRLLGLLLALSARPGGAGEQDIALKVRIGRTRDREAVERAAHGVRRRLADPGCERILSDFADPQGRSLANTLVALGTSPADYLGWVYFNDGFGSGPCTRSWVHAFTVPGSRVVHMCGPRFTALEARDPGTAQAVVLHEVLHTLGLGENPPNSAHITQRVVERCYPEMLASPFTKMGPAAVKR